MLHLPSPQLPCNQLPIQLNAAAHEQQSEHYSPPSQNTPTVASQGPGWDNERLSNRNAFLLRLLAAEEEEESVTAELIVEAVVTIAAHAAVNGSHQGVWGVQVTVTSDVRTLLGSLLSLFRKMEMISLEKA